MKKWRWLVSFAVLFLLLYCACAKVQKQVEQKSVKDDPITDTVEITVTIE